MIRKPLELRNLDEVRYYCRVFTGHYKAFGDFCTCKAAMADAEYAAVENAWNAARIERMTDDMCSKWIGGKK